MFPIRWQSGCSIAIAATSLLCLLSACSPSRHAYFQPQYRSYPSVVIAKPATPPNAAPIDSMMSRALVMPLAATSQPGSVSAPAQMAVSNHHPSKRELLPHLNPDSYPTQRLNRPTVLSATEHVAPRSALIDRHSPNRKTHKLALLALGIALLSYGSLLVTGGSTLLWILSITMPLGATMLGTASLLTINRNKAHYRGKGWAMAAIVIGTGALGLALVAVAALSVSKIVWER